MPPAPRGTADAVAGASIAVSGTRLARNYLACPATPPSAPRRPSLGINLPYLYLCVRVPRGPAFTFEVAVRDDEGAVRRFRASTWQRETVIAPDLCTVPLRLEAERGPRRDALWLPSHKRKRGSDGNDGGDGILLERDGDGAAEEDGDSSPEEDGDGAPCWNRLCVPLAAYTQRAYGTTYVETLRVQIHAHCELRRVYFAAAEVDADDELPEDFRLYCRPAADGARDPTAADGTAP